MAQLQPGDRVGMMDDGRITIRDNAGTSVNRIVDDTQAGAFYQGSASDAGPGSSLTPDDPASNQPVALVNTAQPATETVATAGNAAAVAAPVATPASNPTSFDAYLSGAGASLSAPQQAALAAQLSALDPDGTAGLSLVVLPGGGVLIGNAAGEVVGEIGVAPDGELHLQSQRVHADGSSASVDLHIASNGQATSYSPYQLGQVNATLNLIQGLDGLQHWSRMDDLGHFSSLLGLANSINTLSNGSLGNLSSLNTFSSYISLAQNIEHGNVLGTLTSINGLSNQAIDAALNSALGSTGVPYLNIAVALNDFEHHPGKALARWWACAGAHWARPSMSPSMRISNAMYLIVVCACSMRVSCQKSLQIHPNGGYVREGLLVRAPGLRENRQDAGMKMPFNQLCTSCRRPYPTAFLKSA